MTDDFEHAAVDEYAIVEFTCGACGYLAAVLHDITGWPIFAEYEKHPYEGDIAHIWVVDPSGRAVDINGIHQGDRARTRYSDPDPGRIAPISRADAVGNTDEGYQKWARDIVGSNPAYFGLPIPTPERAASAPRPERRGFLG
jgi:hypothetical protein